MSDGGFRQPLKVASWKRSIQPAPKYLGTAGAAATPQGSFEFLNGTRGTVTASSAGTWDWRSVAERTF